MKVLRNCMLIFFGFDRQSKVAGCVFIIFFHVIYCEKYYFK